MSTVEALHRAGRRILAGTDASSPGTAHGASLHDELSLLVQAGLSPAAALTAATSAPAAALGLPDRGALTPGMRADLVLVHGDPELDITRTRDVAQVWRAGHRAT
jgi:imidazolonepropionase-like amidohydrolase